ncbi:hypothetical protein D6856_03545 [Butyrivibrio sp. XB500-5]|uniref:hypothetical protein n=1 Tax=Butyrivibrio sp. XB500-5 TaxID=2364880 RepID=UPI000EA8CB55|nr:hypothetical protein [Butyrivibrio sp. XB500-5]RKM63210.1 hypothetical protein D6856_03545 [Butyrivibrio sp. XB500-5]
MGINSGKFFDAELSREYYETLKSEKSLYDGKAAVTRSSQNEFNANELFLGNTARAMKMFIKNGTGKMLNDVTDMYSQMLANQEYIMGTFECIVDNSPNARIEYDTLETINKDFKGFYRRFDTLATQAHETIKNLNKDFGEEVPGGFPQPNRKKPLDSFIDICGGDDPSKGYFKECQNKLTSFDDTIKFYLKGRETPFNSADLNKRIKASSGILRSYSHENPNLDPTKVDEIGEPIIKTAKVINNKFSKLCTGIEKYFDKNGDFNYAHGKNAKGSLPCSFAAIEASESPIARAILSSAMYGAVKKYVRDTSLPYSINQSAYRISPITTALSLKLGGAVQSYLEKGNLSDMKKNTLANFEAFQRGGVSYVLDSAVGTCSIKNLLNTDDIKGFNAKDSLRKFFESAGYITLYGSSFFNVQNIVAKGVRNENTYTYSDLLGELSEVTDEDLSFLQETKDCFYSNEEALEKVTALNDDIEAAAKKYGIDKAMLQAILFREIRCYGVDDPVADSLVVQSYSYEQQMESYMEWSSNINFSNWWQIFFRQPPQIPIGYRTDSSTGVGQIFAATAIDAYNSYYGTDYDSSDWHVKEEFWNNLQDDSYSVDMVALVLINNAKELGYDVNNLTDEQLQDVFRRYNGFGDNAEAYGEVVKQYYDSFSEYNGN